MGRPPPSPSFVSLLLLRTFRPACSRNLLSLSKTAGSMEKKKGDERERKGERLSSSSFLLSSPLRDAFDDDDDDESEGVSTKRALRNEVKQMTDANNKLE